MVKGAISGVESLPGTFAEWREKAAAAFDKPASTIPDLAKPTLPPSSGGIELTFDR